MESTDPRAEGLELSFPQQRLWFMHQTAPDNPFYNAPYAYRITGSVDVPALEQALTRTVARHEVLRTRFVDVSGSPRQIIAPPEPQRIRTEDLSSTADPVGEARRVVTRESRRPFELSRGPVIRALMLRLGPRDHVLHLVLHHIATDAWSRQILMEELGAHYRARVEGEDDALSPLPIQYADFAVWQRSQLTGESLREQREYWLEQLQGMPPALELPADKPRPSVPSHEAGTVTFDIPDAVVRALRALGRERGATLFMVLLAGFDALLARLVGTNDVVVGVPVAGRNRSELEGLIGCFVNNLVTRVDCSGDPSFAELVERVREVCLDAFDHQEMPFERLVEELQPVRDLSRGPLVQVGFQLLAARDTSAGDASGSTLELPGLDVVDFGAGASSIRLDLELHCVETSAGVWGRLRYAADLFEHSSIERFVSYFLHLLEEAAGKPDRPLSSCGLVSEAEAHRQLVEWNDTRADTPDSTVVELFEEQARRRPDAPAISFGQETLTYAELDARTNRLAHHLTSLGAGPDVLVGLCAERGPELFVGMIGILKSGAAYVPLDPEYPADRLARMLGDTRCPITVTAGSTRVPAEAAGRIVYLGADGEHIDTFPSHAPPRRVSSDHLAYAIYTSGSTGAPKAVEVTHGSLSNVIGFQSRVFGAGPSSRVLQYSSVCFDASVSEIWVALASGGELVLAPRLLVADELAEELRERRITQVALVPSVLATLPETSLPDLTTLIVGGEAADAGVLNRWLPGRNVFNVYGPTEATVDSTLFYYRDAVTGPLPIGFPVANTQIYVLDDKMRPSPVGVPGEVYIGGSGVARGYRGQPGQTASRFVSHPFGAPGARLYRSGDTARYLPDGNLEFLGRVDDQVKVRGFRVEPAEIENVLAEYEGVRQAVVGLRDAKIGEPRLFAYVVFDPADADTEAQLSEHQIDEWTESFDKAHRLSFENGAPVGGLADAVSSTVVDHVLSRPSAHVLEIGCGTGTLLKRIAGHCGRYVAVDSSQAAIDHLRFDPDVVVHDHVSVMAREASDLVGLEDRSFDTVVLDSVAQYFPSGAHLERVLTRCAELTTDGGRVLVSDLRLLPCGSDVAVRGPSSGVAALAAQFYDESLRHEELAVHPDFLTALARRVPRVTGVELLPSAASGGSCRDVVIRIGDGEQDTAEAISVSNTGNERTSDPLSARRAQVFAIEVAPRLREHARRHLPAHMVPSGFLLLDRLPLTPNGKIDHRTLAAVEPPDARVGRVPATRGEAELIEAFRDILGVEHVGVDDSFFDLGGHSLLAVRLLNRIKETIGVEISIHELFRQSTPAGLATRPGAVDRWSKPVADHF